MSERRDEYGETQAAKRPPTSGPKLPASAMPDDLFTSRAPSRPASPGPADAASPSGAAAQPGQPEQAAESTPSNQAVPVTPQSEPAHAQTQSTPAQPQLRASDQDRRRAATILHEALGRGQLSIQEFDERTAQAWAAVHVSELVPLTADLVGVSPVTGLPGSQVDQPDLHPPASERVTGDGGPTVSFAFWSGFDRKGVWTVPANHTAVAIMGGGDLDLRYANLGAQEVTITAVAIMGGIDVIVPDDVVVRVEGIGFMGAFIDDRKWDGQPPTPPPGAPTIVVRGLALMGGISVVRKPSGPMRQIERE